MSCPTSRTLSLNKSVSDTRLSLSLARLPKRFSFRFVYLVQALPLSLATTHGISVDVCSYGYLDGSVRRVRSSLPMDSEVGDPCGPGCPIRTSWDLSSFASSPTLFAGLHVLLRHRSPRHPSDALRRLILSLQQPTPSPLYATPLLLLLWLCQVVKDH